MAMSETENKEAVKKIMRWTTNNQLIWKKEEQTEDHEVYLAARQLNTVDTYHVQIKYIKYFTKPDEMYVTCYPCLHAHEEIPNNKDEVLDGIINLNNEKALYRCIKQQLESR